MWRVIKRPCDRELYIIQRQVLINNQVVEYLGGFVNSDRVLWIDHSSYNDLDTAFNVYTNLKYGYINNDDQVMYSSV